MKKKSKYCLRKCHKIKSKLTYTTICCLLQIYNKIVNPCLNKKCRTLIVLVSLFIFGCSQDKAPKPLGYFRIDLPAHEYQQFDTNYPFSFSYPVYCTAKPDKDRLSELYWLNLEFRQFRASIHLSYKPITNNLDTVIDDTHTLAWKHSIKADALSEHVYGDAKNDVYGVLYDIKGNTASAIQFYLTDSTRHFIRGALYFNVHPNKDSLSPVLNFIRSDINKFIESFRWKNNFQELY